MKIVRYPHPALRHRSRPLTSIDERIRRHAAEMLELMYASRGIGLAANQVA
jgi:peptide deformylase